MHVQVAQHEEDQALKLSMAGQRIQDPAEACRRTWNKQLEGSVSTVVQGESLIGQKIPASQTVPRAVELQFEPRPGERALAARIGSETIEFSNIVERKA